MLRQPSRGGRNVLMQDWKVLRAGAS